MTSVLISLLRQDIEVELAQQLDVLKEAGELIARVFVAITKLMDAPVREHPSLFLRRYPLGPTRSAMGGTLAVSQVKARQPNFQPSSIVASIE
jgi:hypothetical protein